MNYEGYTKCDMFYCRFSGNPDIFVEIFQEILLHILDTTVESIFHVSNDLIENPQNLVKDGYRPKKALGGLCQ